MNASSGVLGPALLAQLGVIRPVGGVAASWPGGSLVYATYLTRSDIDAGPMGAARLVELAGVVLGLEGGRSFRDPVTREEGREFDFGRRAVHTAVLAGGIGLIIVSSPLALGGDRASARAFMDFLEAHGVAVFAGVWGVMDVERLAAFRDQWLEAPAVSA